jgi:hypothetical protein
MDFLEDYVDKNLLSKANVLKYVDDYSLFSKYIGSELELYTKYSSPLREGDDDPSFSLYYSKYNKEVIMFKDNATGKHGDVFKFLRYLMGGGEELVHLRLALLQINSDFQLGLNNEERGEFVPQLIKTRPLARAPVKIEVTSHQSETQQYLDYWNNLEISKRTRNKYFCKDVKVVHYITDIHLDIAVRSMAVSYEIIGFYKVYQPFEHRKYKFRNNYPSGFVEGAIQLQFESDFAIITKSTKEIMFLDEHFGWECVAGTSENSMVNAYFMENTLKVKYKRVFIWLDNDEAGRVAQQRYLDMYPWLEPIIFDEFLKDSDPTDLFSRLKNEGKRTEALAYLKHLIEGKL